MKKVNLEEAFTRFDEVWAPRVVAELNGQQVKLARLDGEFVWHSHEDQDELFYVIEGRLCMELRDRQVWIEPGELFVVPRGVEHRPVAPVPTRVLLFEPAETVNTGDAGGDRTRAAQWL